MLKGERGSEYGCHCSGINGSYLGAIGVRSPTLPEAPESIRSDKRDISGFGLDVMYDSNNRWIPPLTLNRASGATDPRAAHPGSGRAHGLRLQTTQTSGSGFRVLGFRTGGQSATH